MLPLIVVAYLFVAGCGTVGSLASPTPLPSDVPELTPTPSFTDEAKAVIEVLFLDQSRSISAGDWNVAFQSCSPSYRSRREVERFTEDVERYLLRLDTAPAKLDVRNPVVTKGRDDRFDLNYDLYIDGEYAETVRVGGAYIQIRGEWYDDGVWCR